MNKLVKHVITLGLSVLTALVILMLAGPGRVHHTSMLPTFQDGDSILLSKALYKLTKPERQDIIAISDPIKKQFLIKRVVAVEGDRIRITPEGEFYLNGELQYEGYIYEQNWTAPALIDTKIPEDCVFVMGDNRNDSYDSRYELSFVGTHQILARVVLNFSELLRE